MTEVDLEKEDRIEAPEKKKYQCENKNCNWTFTNERNLNYHLKNVCNKQRRYKCGYCEYRAHIPSDVKLHQFRKHDKQKMKIEKFFRPNILSRTRNFSCPGENCKKTFNSTYNLEQHRKFECGKIPKFKCFYCDFKTSFEYVIKQHWVREHPREECCFETLS